MATRPNKRRETAPAGVVTAFSYLRYSSPAQSEGDSVRRQTALRESWLRRHPHVRLDDTLTLEDHGVSGFRGEHRTNRKHALSRFLDEVDRGRVPRGSYLIVENLDRLTREQFEESVPAVLALIKAGVKVVQLSPTEIVYESGMDEGRKLLMIMELSRGHGESERKSVLVGEAYVSVEELARYLGDGRGDEFHLAFNFELLKSPWEHQHLTLAVERSEALHPPGVWPTYAISNHDQSRHATRWGAERARAAAFLLLTLRGPVATATAPRCSGTPPRPAASAM